jgi:cytochrome b6-f complex iron-sulfur subunit
MHIDIDRTAYHLQAAIELIECNSIENYLVHKSISPDPNKIMIKRRSFLTYFSIGWFTSCFPVVLAACAPGKSTTSATTTAEVPATEDKGAAKPAKKTADGFIVVGAVAQLKKAGYLQTKEIAVSIDPTNPNKLLAVNTKCTHQGCTVAWIPGDKKYDCPCHDSEFAADGKVLKGPAAKPLVTYSAKIVGTEVLVKMS